MTSHTVPPVRHRRATALSVIAALWIIPVAHAAASEPESFASPEQAADALIAAARSDDPAKLLEIYGSAGRDLISSGDPVADREAHARFVDHYGEGNKIWHDRADHAALILGTQQWPFPVPIVQRDGAWHFDAEAGLQEILNRRIGRNELSAIEVCRSYVQAQRDYAADLAGEHGRPEYAQRIVSSIGRHDGLYWPADSGEKPSPIGPLMASARAEGYSGASDKGETRAPYHGYYYKILLRQGTTASGGARDYVVAGHMTGGFALIAFPASYGDSGVMSFLIDQDGLVFEKDLGPDTATLAPAIAAFNPDLTWRVSHGG